MPAGKKVAILLDQQEFAEERGSNASSEEFDFLQIVCDALKKSGQEVSLLFVDSGFQLYRKNLESEEGMIQYNEPLSWSKKVIVSEQKIGISEVKEVFDFVVFVPEKALSASMIRLREMFDVLGISHSGYSELSGALGVLDRHMQVRVLGQGGFNVPRFEYVEAVGDENKLFKSIEKIIAKRIHYPAIVKPVVQGERGHLSLVKVESKAHLQQVVADLTGLSDGVWVESFIEGQELFCTVVSGRNDGLVLVPTELVNRSDFPKGEESMLESWLETVTPPYGLSTEEVVFVQEESRRAAKYLGLSPFSFLSGFYVKDEQRLKDSKVFFLGSSTLPLRLKRKLTIKQAETSGVKVPDLLSIDNLKILS